MRDHRTKGATLLDGPGAALQRVISGSEGDRERPSRALEKALERAPAAMPGADPNWRPVSRSQASRSWKVVGPELASPKGRRATHSLTFCFSAASGAAPCSGRAAALAGAEAGEARSRARARWTASATWLRARPGSG